MLHTNAGKMEPAWLSRGIGFSRRIRLTGRYGKAPLFAGLFHARDLSRVSPMHNKRVTRRLQAPPSLGRCLRATHVPPRPPRRDLSAGRGRLAPGRRCDAPQQAERRMGLVRPARPASGPARSRARGADSMTERPWLGAAAAAEKQDTAPQRRRWSPRYGRRRGRPASVRPRSAATSRSSPAASCSITAIQAASSWRAGAGERRPATR